MENINKSTYEIKPFLHWAGGKSRLISQINQYLPHEDFKAKKLTKYIEPFVGGGALFFYLIQKYDFEYVCLSDLNADLIVTYKTIKKYPNELINELQKIKNKYFDKNPDEQKQMFLDTRDLFNEQIVNPYVSSEDWVTRSCLFIFLNKTCFNGLYRVNSKNKFNSPFGKHVKPKIFEPENLLAMSKILQNIDLRISSYEECRYVCDDKTFIYFDPPFRPISDTSNFTGYTSSKFDDSSQKDLFDFIKTLSCKWMLSNSEPKNTNENDNFFGDLYSGYSVQRVLANRCINSDATKRNKIFELLITNY